MSKVTIKLKKDQALYIGQILEQEKAKFEGVSPVIKNPTVKKFENELDSIVKIFRPYAGV